MPTGAIQFVGDSSQLSSEAAKARQSVSSVAVSAEDARKRIVASYQQQMEAAKKFGASQAQLEAITRRSSQQLAGVTEDSARRYINAIDRMEDRTKRFNAARASLATAIPQQPVSQFTFGGNAAKEAEELSHAIDGVSAAHTRGVPPGVRFGSVMRGIEGNFSRNVRAAEVFGSTLSFLEPFVAAAFPVVGALTLGYALVEMGKHAYEAFENIVQLKGAIDGLNALQINVANTVGKNNDSAEASVESILEATQGRAASLRQKYSYQSQKPLDLASYFYSDEFKKLPDNIKGNYERMYKSVAPADVPERLRSIKKEIVDLNAAAAQAKVSPFVPRVGGFGPSATSDPNRYYQARLIAANQIQQQLESGSSARSASLQGLQVSIPKAQQDEAKKAQQEALSAHREAIAARKQADQLSIQNQEQDHLSWMAVQDRSKLDAVLYWSSIVALTNSGSARAIDARKKYLEANVALNREQAETMKRTLTEFSKSYLADYNERGGLDPATAKGIDRSGGDASDYIASLRASIDLTKQSSDAIAENAIQMALATGQMSKLGAARAMAALRQQQYIDGLKELREQAAVIKADPTLTDLGRKAALQNNANQTRDYQVQGGMQAQRDQVSIMSADPLNQFVLASRDLTGQLKEASVGLLNGINGQIINAMSGQKTNFGSVASGAAKGIANAGLKSVEGTVLGAFGLGKLGTKSNPMYTISAGAPGVPGVNHGMNALKGIGGIFKKLFSSLPHFAGGGNFDGLSVVGEDGPELISGSGAVTPNNRISSVLGKNNGGNISYTIDARGTDPVQAAQRVRTAIAASHQSSVAHSIAQSRDLDRRRPGRPI